MKAKIVSFFRLFFIITGVEIIFFFSMIFFIMTDGTIGIFGKVLSFIVKNILSFPLVLLKREYPFFIDSGEPPSYMIPLVILNLFMQTSIVVFIQKLTIKRGSDNTSKM